MSRTSRAAALSLLLASASTTAVLGTPVAANANCAAAGEIGYSVSAVDTRVPFKRVPVFKNGPGGSVSATRGYSGTATYSVTAGAESEVGAVLAKAKVSVSASLTKSNTTDTTITYNHAIPRGKYGNLQYVSWGKRVSWTKYQINSNCTGTRTLATGKINFPSTAEGWFYWTTTS